MDQDKPETRLLMVDGRDALACVIVRPTPTGNVEIEASADGISQEQAAYILRHVADQWDPK